MYNYNYNSIMYNNNCIKLEKFYYLGQFNALKKTASIEKCYIEKC